MRPGFLPKALMGLAQLLVDGLVPPSIIPLLAVCSFTPLAKPLPKGGIRPLAVGEVLRRVTARAICLQYRSQFEADLSPHQFAVAKPTGVEVIHKAVGVLASSSSSGCVVALDIRNAYNSIYRKACLNSLGFARPEL